MIVANDNARAYWVLFFAGPDCHAAVIDAHGPFDSEHDAVAHSLESFAIAKRDGLDWSPTEIVYE